MNSKQSATFIDHQEIEDTLAFSQFAGTDRNLIRSILVKARLAQGLTHREAAVLLHNNDDQLWSEIYQMARQIKERIYGKRIVLFAPLYISNYCVNNCSYCGYKVSNRNMTRRRLSQDEIAEEVRVLESLGHKRLALEAGEDPAHCDLDYVIESLHTIYSVKVGNGSIRRVNVNIAATTEENYRRLKEAEIGTYILFQETYHRPTYAAVHPSGPKHNYDWHATAMDRALRAGIDDVGIGVLYGLYDYRYETVALLMHAEHLNDDVGIGPHTISVPRLRAASSVDLRQFPYLVSDEEFKRIVAVLRLSVPYTGMILSTREEPAIRDEVISLGISQISAGSCTEVGGYVEAYQTNTDEQTSQFDIGDHRSPLEVVKALAKSGYIPSFCTACYRAGRTGDRFMPLAKSGEIQNVCQPNAILTFKEFQLDYGDDELHAQGDALIAEHLALIPKEAIKEATQNRLQRLESGERDLRF